MKTAPHQQACYDAEHALRSRSLAGRMLDKQEIERYAFKVLCSKEWFELVPEETRRDIEVIFAKDEPLCAHRDEAVWLRFDPDQTDELIVLHELAHVTTPGGGHRESFIHYHQRLVYHFLGTDSWIEFNKLLREKGAAVT